MVGHDDDPAPAGQVLELGLAYPDIELEVAQRLLDKIHAAQVRVVGGEALELIFVQQMAQQRAQQVGEGSGGEVFAQQGIDTEHGTTPWCCPERIAPPYDREGSGG